MMKVIYDKLPYAPHSSPCWVRPTGLVPWNSPECGHDAHHLAGGWMGFTKVAVATKYDGHIIIQEMGVDDWRSQSQDKPLSDALYDNLTKARTDFAGLSMARPQVMGIVNVTPDSFSDGGRHYASDDAITGAKRMAAHGATILDVGGESTRPGAEQVGFDEEIRRITPVIEALSRDGYVVSADTRHTDVMAQALQKGAPIINDVGGFRDVGAPDLLASAAQNNPDKAFAIAMHMQGTPETMQKNPFYDFAPLDVYDWLAERIAVLEQAGLPRSHIAIDPGFGFGKTPRHNLELIRWTSLFQGLGVPVLIGVSRKSSIAKLSKDEAATDRLGGSLALTLEAIAGGAQMIRTHDVPETVQAISLYQQVQSA